MNRRVVPLIIGSLLLTLGCGGDSTGPDFATLEVVTASLLDGSENVAYSETLAATGGDESYTWSVTVGSLPVGLSLTALSGAITGTPSAVGSSAFTVQVASGDGQTATQALSITVNQLVLQPAELCSANPATAIVTFEDANLAAAIRAALGIGAQDDLTCGLVSGLTGLTAQSAGIASLLGIQNLTGLTNLDLGSNSITDISPLGGLTGLTDLDLENNPNLIDAQPLLDNTGLGAGDTIDLESTNVSCAHVVLLQLNGVTVFSDFSAAELLACGPVMAPVTVGDFFFSPESITVAPGGTVAWDWVGSVGHNVTFETSAGISPSPTQTSGMFEATMPTVAATYTYQCTIHPAQMNGSVTVQ